MLPEGTQIVDLHRVRQYLHDLAGILEFMLGDQRDDWLAARLDDLGHRDIDGICKAARVYSLLGTKKESRTQPWGTSSTARLRMRACVWTGPMSGTPRAACTIVARRSAFVRRFRVPTAIGPVLQPVSAVKAQGPPRGGRPACGRAAASGVITPPGSAGWLARRVFPGR